MCMIRKALAGMAVLTLGLLICACATPPEAEESFASPEPANADGTAAHDGNEADEETLPMVWFAGHRPGEESLNSANREDLPEPEYPANLVFQSRLGVGSVVNLKFARTSSASGEIMEAIPNGAHFYGRMGITTHYIQVIWPERPDPDAGLVIEYSYSVRDPDGLWKLVTETVTVN